MKLGKTDVATVLDACESDLHDRVLAMRDQAFAHSDVVAHEFEELDYSEGKAMFYKPARDPLTREETRKLRRMIRKWFQHINKLREGAVNE